MLEGNCSPSECRALVAIEPSIEAPRPQHRLRADPGFVAHLIAMADQAPQLREKRRAEPQEAAAAYAAAIERFSVQ